MQILMPDITQNDFDYAIECLEVCKQDHAQQYGFNYPYFTPGGAYGKQWWQLDSSLALRGYQWIDREFVERSLWNFIESQKEDGRICLWGADLLPKKVAGNNFPKQNKNVSSLPKIFDVAYHILQGSKDQRLKIAAYNMIKHYLNWWFSQRQDPETGLKTSVFEETFIPYLGSAGEYAAVDTNVEVYVGCHYADLLASELEKRDEAAEFQAKKLQLKQSINDYLWNEEAGAFFPYLVKEQKLHNCLMASTFYPLRMQIANKEKQKRLIALLKDQEHFNWSKIPLTSVSMKDKAFVTTRGGYQGNASWSGNVWTLINEMVVRGLLDCGENELAAKLAFSTVSSFNHNCTEFVNPFDGTGHGVKQYAWTASQYLELIIEILFGIRYIAKENVVRVSPTLTEQMKEEYLYLECIPVATGVYLNVKIDHGRISCSVSSDSVKVDIIT